MGKGATTPQADPAGVEEGLERGVQAVVNREEVDHVDLGWALRGRRDGGGQKGVGRADAGLGPFGLAVPNDGQDVGAGLPAERDVGRAGRDHG